MHLRHFFCPQCQTRYPAAKLNQRCAKCGSTMMSRYDYEGIKRNLAKQDLASRSQTLWRYKELLPVFDESNIVSLGEGMSPVLRLPRLEAVLQARELFIKDDSRLPCNSVRARVASVTVSKALELGARALIARTTCMEGLAWATYASRAGLALILLVAKDEVEENYKNAILKTGASLLLYEGAQAEADALAEKTATDYGWLNASAYYEPYRLEGKKTIGLEMAEQFEWNLPEVIICPVGGGGTLASIYKALRELGGIGWIPPQLPRLVAVQPERFAPIVRAFNSKQRVALIPEHDGDINFDEDVEFSRQSSYIAMDGIYKTVGCAVSVTVEETTAAGCILASREGMLCEEKGQLAMAAAIKLARSGWIKKSDRVLLYNPEGAVFNTSACQNTAGHINLKNDPYIPKELGMLAMARV